MDESIIYGKENEKPLDNILDGSGFVGIFRNIACIGDSLSSGEFQSQNKDGTYGYHDMYEYSWGQYVARACGSIVYNFSEGGLTAKEFNGRFANVRDCFNINKACTAYIMALGVNDLIGKNMPVGDIGDINFDDYNKNKDTFCGEFAKIIQRFKEVQPRAKFFLLTMPIDNDANGKADKCKAHAKLMYDLAKVFKYTYVIDLQKYAIDYSKKEFKEAFFHIGHMTPAGYVLTGKMVVSYIDYIIRHNFKDFAQVGFIGTKMYDENLDNDTEKSKKL